MRMKASATIEAIVACSVFFLSFFLVVNGLFYYHDKNILMGTAYEAAVVQSQKKRSPETCTVGEVEQSFERAAKRRMLLFSKVDLTIEETDQKVTVRGTASKRRMKLSVSQSASVTEPEKFIRNMRKAGVHEDGI
nr:pilus assembly protein [uncultured Faecalimonas sp.]